MWSYYCFFLFRTVNIQTISFRSFSAVVIALVSYSGHAANAWHCLSTNLFSCIIFNPIEVFLIAVIIGCRSVGTSLSRAVSLTHCSCVCASARQKWVTLSWTAWRAVNIIRHLLIWQANLNHLLNERSKLGRQGAYRGLSYFHANGASEWLGSAIVENCGTSIEKVVFIFRVHRNVSGTSPENYPASSTVSIYLCSPVFHVVAKALRRFSQFVERLMNA